MVLGPSRLWPGTYPLQSRYPASDFRFGPRWVPTGKGLGRGFRARGLELVVAGVQRCSCFSGFTNPRPYTLDPTP
eukprot:3075032-Rhodomonas_salina.1